MSNSSLIQISSKRFKAPVGLYGHWSGKENLEAVKTVLAKTSRIGDPSYLVAQIFYEFATILGKYDGEYSFGIDAYGDNINWLTDHHTVYVDADTGIYTYRGVEHNEFEPEQHEPLARLVAESKIPKTTREPKPAGI